MGLPMRLFAIRKTRIKMSFLMKLVFGNYSKVRKINYVMQPDEVPKVN